MEENDRLTIHRQRFQIIVNVIQARLCMEKKSKTKIKVFLGKQKKTIRTKGRKVDCPRYNDYCLFNVFLPLTSLVCQTLTVRMYKSSRKLVGGFSVELSTIWSQPNHRLVNKWAVLINPKDVNSDVKGFLKCDIAIVRRFEVKSNCEPCEPEKVTDSKESENYTENLLVPQGDIYPRFKTRFIFCVYRADSFSFLKSSDSHVVSPCVKITYAGHVLQTTPAKNDVWNEELAFCDSGPPFCQNIYIEMCDCRKSRRKKSVGNTSINLFDLCENSVNGFLPTLGPTFLYLYEPLKKIECHRENVPMENSFTYSCRLLIAMRTEMVSCGNQICVKKKKKSKKNISSICPLNECAYFSYRKFILFAVVFDVLFFDKSRHANVAVRLTIGPKKSNLKIPPSSKKSDSCPNYQFPVANPKNPLIITDCSKTPRHRLKVRAGCSFVAFSGKFPCVHVYGEWPDSLRKIYRSNVLKRAIQNCTKEVDKIKCDLQFDEITATESSNKLKRLLTNLSKSCEVIMLLTKVITLEDTNLAREKKRVYHEEISEIMRKTKLASTANGLIGGEELTKISTYLSRLRKYARDPENSFPDTEIWILKSGKITAQIRIRTEDITYSPDCNQRGLMSGKMQTLILRGEKEKIKAKLDVFLWFGLAEDFVQCLNMLPSGYQNFPSSKCSTLIDNRIPTGIIYAERHEFLCRAYIFYAKILTNCGKTRTPNPLAKVIVLGNAQVTHVRKGTFCPVWKETLLIPKIILYGPLEEIEKNSITITVEIYDKRKSRRKKLIGRSFVKPAVKLLGGDSGPPKFQWEDIIRGSPGGIGKILMAVELWVNCEKIPKKDRRFPIADSVSPPSATFRLEVLFWGVREMKWKSYLRNSVFATVKCGDKLIKSQIIKNVRRKLNFPGCVQYVELELPENPEHAPPISLKLYHLKSFTGVRRGVATCTVSNVRSFCYVTLNRSKCDVDVETETCDPEKTRSEKKQKLFDLTMKTIKCFLHVVWLILICFLKYCKRKIFRDECDVIKQEENLESVNGRCIIGPKDCEGVYDNDEDHLSWWGKYYASAETCEESFGTSPPLKFYRQELEFQPEFKEFTDFLHKFDMIVRTRRKKKEVLVAKVKAALKFYKLSSESKQNCSILLSNSPSNEAMRFFVRVYIITGKNLRYRRTKCPSNPYLCLKLGSQQISDRNNYASNRINPVFAKCFEMNGTFPKDHLLRIKVMDRGPGRRDKVIGETTIDLENRYYSRHHATCGLSKSFEKEGLAPWRDVQAPTYILQNACRRSNLGRPIYECDRVIINDYVFRTNVSSGTRYREENQALSVLHRWQEISPIGYHMVPEHVETRSLYRSRLPGIEQGKLEMWIDIFPESCHFLPPKVDIIPGRAVPMELRAIVWNVDDVLLEEESFVCNEKTSSIYVKGWIYSLEDDIQTTDADCRPANGKGSFNWRFIFRFNYVPSERIMVVKGNADALGDACEERRHRCKLEMQIWDNDAFGNDYLGTLLLELCSMPCGAKLSNRCTLKMLAPNASKINLFKIGKTRGWWPFRRLKEKEKVGAEFELTGKIDLELEVLTKAEAALNPAGKGRCEPNALPLPKRSKTTFWEISASFRMLCHLLKQQKKVFWTCGVFVVVFLFVSVLILIKSS